MEKERSHLKENVFCLLRPKKIKQKEISVAYNTPRLNGKDKSPSNIQIEIAPS